MQQRGSPTEPSAIQVDAAVAAVESVAFGQVVEREEQEEEEDWETLADGDKLPDLSVENNSVRAEVDAPPPELQELLASLGLIGQSAAAALQLPPACPSTDEHGEDSTGAQDGRGAAERVCALSRAVLEHLRARERGSAAAGAVEPEGGPPHPGPQAARELSSSNLFCIGEHILLLALASSERFPPCVLLEVVQVLSSAVAAEARFNDDRARQP